MDLTNRQQEILSWVQEFIAVNSFPPTRAEIAKAFGFGTNAAHDHLLAIAAKGRIEIIDGISRGIRVLP